MRYKKYYEKLFKISLVGSKPQIRIIVLRFPNKSFECYTNNLVYLHSNNTSVIHILNNVLQYTIVPVFCDHYSNT